MSATATLEERVERLLGLLEERELDCLLVTDLLNLRYLTGFTGSNGACVVAREERLFFTDFRYARKAAQLEGVRFEQTARAVIADLATRLAGRTVWVEGHVLTVAALETLRAGGVDAVPQQGLVERLRAVKDESEVGTLREAAAISDQVFGALAEERFTGRTEVELVWRLRELFREHGSAELSFDAMVAAGDNGASPHSDNRDVAIEPNMLVIVDAGCRVDGYASDCTRTFATGELPDELASIYATCLDAQLSALEAMGPGVPGREADAAAREPIGGEPRTWRLSLYRLSPVTLSARQA